MFKKIIIRLFHFVRRILTAFRNHLLPIPKNTSPTLHVDTTPPPSFYGNVYELYFNEEIKKSYEYFKNFFKKSVLLRSPDYHRYIIEKAKENDPLSVKFYLESGVFEGSSINFFSKYVNTIYGFDSFQGLKEDWVGWILPKGTFNLNKKLPTLNKNVIPVIGWVQDTLSPFLDKHKPEINFVHLDMDTYESTKFVLKKIKPYLIKNSIIAFDQIYNFPGWQLGEYKALIETFNDNEYKFICFDLDRDRAAIQII